MCFATMEQQAANARYERLHHDRPWHDGTFTDWAKEPSRAYPYRFNFGVTIGVTDSDIRPNDKFLSVEDCGPPTTELPASQPHDDENDPSDNQDSGRQS